MFKEDKLYGSRLEFNIMFGKKVRDFTVEDIDSIIGAGALLEGTLTTKNTTRVDGHIIGDVNTNGILVVGGSGKIEGTIHAHNVLVAGEVRGDMHAAERVEVSSSGKVFGDIRTKSLQIDENAQFSGQCTMNITGKEPEKLKTAEE